MSYDTDTEIAIANLSDASDLPSSNMIFLTLGGLSATDTPAANVETPLLISVIAPVDVNAIAEPEAVDFNFLSNDIWAEINRMAEDYVSKKKESSEPPEIIPAYGDQAPIDPDGSEQFSVSPVSVDPVPVDASSGTVKSAFQSGPYYSGKANFNNSASRWQTFESANSFLGSKTGRFTTGWGNIR